MEVWQFDHWISNDQQKVCDTSMSVGHDSPFEFRYSRAFLGSIRMMDRRGLMDQLEHFIKVTLRGYEGGVYQSRLEPLN